VLEIRTLAVIGAGISGRAMACAGAMGGYRTIVEDILPASLRKAEAELRTSLGEGNAVLERIEYASSLEEAARQADLVIEALPDELESKLEIFTLLDKICRPRTILALSSSTLRVTDVASVTCRPQKCVGMRFAKLGQNTKSLELVRGYATDEETLAACSEVGRQMGKEVLVVVEESGC
jgi:3-hydroxybutyryl-CoA dehydrogenase